MIIKADQASASNEGPYKYQLGMAIMGSLNQKEGDELLAATGGSKDALLQACVAYAPAYAERIFNKPEFQDMITYMQDMEYVVKNIVPFDPDPESRQKTVDDLKAIIEQNKAAKVSAAKGREGR